MFEHLYLRHFQKHNKLNLELKQVTTIVGRTGSGKSAILRALRWIQFNYPDGDAFMRKGARDVKAELTTDGYIITRRRGSRGNAYLLDGRVLEAFGRGWGSVPEDIAKILNVDRINYQSQFDQHYLLSLNAAKVSRELNAVIDLGSIDEVLMRAANAVQRETITVNITQQRSIQVAEEAKDIARKKIRAEAASLKKLLEEGQRLEAEIEVAVPDLSRLDALRAKVKGTEMGKKALYALLTEGRRLEAEGTKLGKKAVALEAQLREESKGLCPVCGGELKL